MSGLLKSMLLGLDISPSEAGITYENFTTYTESDPNNRLSQTQLRSTFTTLLRTDPDTYLYKNKAGQLQNFTYRFKLRVTFLSDDASTIRADAFAVIEVLGSYNPNRLAGYEQFGLQLRSASSSTLYYWYLFETYNVTLYGTQSSNSYDKDTDYYVEITKSGTSLTIKFYSDANFTNLIESKSLTLHGNWNLPYLVAPQGPEMNTSIGISGYIENLYEV